MAYVGYLCGDSVIEYSMSETTGISCYCALVDDHEIIINNSTNYITSMNEIIERDCSMYVKYGYLLHNVIEVPLNNIFATSNKIFGKRKNRFFIILGS